MVARLAGPGVAVSEQVAIAPWLTMRIGGRVRCLVNFTTSKPLAEFLQNRSAMPLPLIILGGGSNVVFTSGLTEAIVVIVSTKGIKRAAENLLWVEAGTRNVSLLSWCGKHGAGGLDFLAGIPGTVGGAAAVNAGAFGRSLAEIISAAEVIDERGRLQSIGRDEFGFAYRDSRFKYGNVVLLRVALSCFPEKSAEIAAKVRSRLEYRKKNHPSYRLFSAGCFFKNPLQGASRISAGKLIEECGLKGLRQGGMEISTKHGNFLINRGQATFVDLQRLEEKIKETVFAKTGITLEREVIYVSTAGEKI
jgi:UDP-N-acetylmuramate dehydrogenase